MSADNLRTFESGAVRCADADKARYDLISHIGLRRLAETCAEGAAKYGDHNWLKGIPASNLLNHLLAHLNQFKAGDTSEDHLAHAAWGVFALMHFQETRPDLMDVPPKIPVVSKRELDGNTIFPPCPATASVSATIKSDLEYGRAFVK